MKTTFFIALMILFVILQQTVFAQTGTHTQTAENNFSSNGGVCSAIINKDALVMKNNITKHSDVVTSDGGRSTLFTNQTEKETPSEKTILNEEMNTYPLSDKNTESVFKKTERVAITIYDMTGKFVISKKIVQENVKGIEDLPNGIYIYLITNNQDEIIETGKIIK